MEGRGYNTGRARWSLRKEGARPRAEFGGAGERKGLGPRDEFGGAGGRKGLGHRPSSVKLSE